MTTAAPFAYIVVRCLTTGPVPWANEILSLGAVSFAPSGIVLGKLTQNLALVRDDSGDGPTMKWWTEHEGLFAAARATPLIHPTIAMRTLRGWLAAQAPKLQFLCNAWDWMWVYQYLLEYTGDCPLGRRPLDIMSWASAHEGKLGPMPPAKFNAAEDAMALGKWYFASKKRIEDG